MNGSITARCCRLALVSAATLLLTIAPYRIALQGPASGINAAVAQAAKGGNGGGNGGNSSGNGNGSGGSGGNSSSNGNGNGGSGGNSGGGNSGNGNGNGGNSGTDGGDDGGGNSGPGASQSTGTSHVNATTGDKVSVDGSKISVEHPNGMTEKIENGRFSMRDALGRTIIDRRATPADVRRLKAL
ncbi:MULTISPECIES: hypothetical protein [Mesorhizobium]|uniref:Uncharacterized protein n=1 Tax=Rhizobium loti TaxID=381 RepID=A0A6M7TWT1_RHILI|nr:MULTISPECIES: hypothetical protein [Mesorhizobium]KRB20635.1 hypothetical protein ASE05_18230 [Mesorhizobium sp. Root172]OBQ65339.1 hypothetical protein A8145_14225 [Mesorhizobium loti]QKC68458.1 hypothetical protein EB815_04495 [Mesorhizobium loti]QKC87761.1 hypothetical protein EB230_04440 [Mesorhizobium sp. NZP2234]